MNELLELGFLKEPETNSNGGVYTGKLCLDDVQITHSDDIIVTVTVTVRQILDAASAGLLWTDQDVQRGIRPEIETKVEKELNLNDGYPDDKKYIFNSSNADDIVEKLLKGESKFINPLVWSLRPNTFEAFYDKENRKIYIYDGKIYLPDSHHRHQALLKAAKIFKEAKSDFPKFNLKKQFKVDLYFFTKEDEGNYFFAKNKLNTAIAKSKAYDLTTTDDLSILAKKVIESTEIFKGNVNRVTDSLSNKNSQLITLSTLRQCVRNASLGDSIDDSQFDGLVFIISKFFELLSTVRPELKSLPISERLEVRSSLLVAAPIMFQSYGDIISDFNSELANGLLSAEQSWTKKLLSLSSSIEYSFDNWKGDIFSIHNPLWLKLGVVKFGTNGNINLVNSRTARSQATKALRAILSNDRNNTELKDLL